MQRCDEALVFLAPRECAGTMVVHKRKNILCIAFLVWMYGMRVVGEAHLKWPMGATDANT